MKQGGKDSEISGIRMCLVERNKAKNKKRNTYTVYNLVHIRVRDLTSWRSNFVNFQVLTSFQGPL